MNLDADPKEYQLRNLLARCHDAAGPHLLWVKRTGDVEIARLPENQSPASFQKDHPEMQIRYDAFLAGNEYVGPEAAADVEWVAELFASLLKEWRQAKGKAGVATVGRF